MQILLCEINQSVSFFDAVGRVQKECSGINFFCLRVSPRNDGLYLVEDEYSATPHGDRFEHLLQSARRTCEGVGFQFIDLSISNDRELQIKCHPPSRLTRRL